MKQIKYDCACTHTPACCYADTPINFWVSWVVFFIVVSVLAINIYQDYHERRKENHRQGKRQEGGEQNATVPTEIRKADL